MSHAPRERMPAHGGSMFPFVPAGSVLELRPRGERAIVVGDIVCYPGARGELVAHRVLARASDARGTTRERVWITRGDALDAEERVPETAIAWVVESVTHRGVCYRTDSTFGRVLARIAVRRGPLQRTCQRLARGAARLAQVARVAIP